MRHLFYSLGDSFDEDDTSRARARARMHARTHASPLIFHHARHLVTVGLLTSLSFHLPALPAPPPIISFHAAARCPRAQTRRMNFNDGL
jgi:hypothetical protein